MTIAMSNNVCLSYYDYDYHNDYHYYSLIAQVCYNVDALVLEL